MREIIKRIVLRMFPELTGGLHLDRYARVLAVTDAPEAGGTCERFRPRYAVDLQVLTPEGEVDEAYPVYQTVPLPVSMGAGMEAGQFGFPEPGTLVVLGFAYGRPDHPVIRQVYPLGLSLPDLAQDDQRWQHSAEAYQGVDKDGNWTRKTHTTITDESLRHERRTVEAVDELTREVRRIAENSTEEVGGVKVLEALGALKLLTAGRLNLSAGGGLNITTASGRADTTAGDFNAVTGGHKTETVKGNQTKTVNGSRGVTVGGGQSTTIGADLTENVTGGHTASVGGDCSQTVGGDSTEDVTGNKSITAQQATMTGSASVGIIAPTIAIGHGGTDVLQLTISFMDEVRLALEDLASHTHEGGTISDHDQEAEVTTHGSNINALKGQLQGLTE